MRRGLVGMAVGGLLERFPFLPAQRAGRWTVIVAKPSGPAATIRIAITFVKP